MRGALGINAEHLHGAVRIGRLDLIVIEIGFRVGVPGERGRAEQADRLQARHLGRRLAVLDDRVRDDIGIDRIVVALVEGAQATLDGRSGRHRELGARFGRRQGRPVRLVAEDVEHRAGFDDIGGQVGFRARIPFKHDARHAIVDDRGARAQVLRLGRRIEVHGADERDHLELRGDEHSVRAEGVIGADADIMLDRQIARVGVKAARAVEDRRGRDRVIVRRALDPDAGRLVVDIVRVLPADIDRAEARGYGHDRQTDRIVADVQRLFETRAAH